VSKNPTVGCGCDWCLEHLSGRPAPKKSERHLQLLVKHPSEGELVSVEGCAVTGPYRTTWRSRVARAVRHLFNHRRQP
jgi:hypothetical protein